jgi:hypothetical protein
VDKHVLFKSGIRTTARVLAALLLAVVLTDPAAAQLYSCRSYPPSNVVVQIKAGVEAMRRIEREAADRLTGLDTRPYDWLHEQARAAEAAIAVPALLAGEDALMRCRNFVRPLRRDCAVAAAALVRVIGELVAGEATGEAKTAYAQTMPHCERTTALTPLDTALRTVR